MPLSCLRPTTYSTLLLDLACDSIDIFESDATIAHNDYQQPVTVLLMPSMTFTREMTISNLSS